MHEWANHTGRETSMWHNIMREKSLRGKRDQTFKSSSQVFKR